MNPADLPSRGCSPAEFLSSKWWEGMDWMKKPEAFWPKEDETPDEEEVAVEERKTAVAYARTSQEEDTSEILSSLAQRISSTSKLFNRKAYFSKLVSVFAYMLRSVNGVKPKKTAEVPSLTVDELEVAEKKLLKLVQSSAKLEDLKIAKMSIDEDGLRRVETKIVRRDDLDYFVRPILLPKKNQIVEMIIIECHLRNHHAGIQTTMLLLREKYWVPSCRKTVKKVIDGCGRCRRFKGKSADSVTTPLPLDRISDAAVFEVTGVDLAGPLFLKTGEKTWIVLYTCATYRVVHLELVMSESTECFLQSFRRFVARRGRPVKVYSDNGRNFVGAESLFEAINWEEVAKVAAIDRIKWQFIPPRSPWWGGWWERLVKLVKELLVRVLGKAVLSYEELLTVICDVESTVNERPLTYISEDAEDFVPLRPADFIKDLRASGVADVDIIEAQEYQRRFRYRQKVRDEFRSRFRQEYLSELVQKAQEKPVKPLELNEVVLVEDEGRKRQDWKIGRIIELFPGVDGHVRVVRVKTEKGILKRSVQRVFPLEVRTKTVEVPVPEVLPPPEVPVAIRQ